MYPCVPLNLDWTGSTKLDLHGIYDRGNGDLCTLPMRRHQQWMAKGFSYVTLADAESFKKAVPFLQAVGKNPQDYIAGIDGDGRPTPWIAAKYIAEQQATRADSDAELKGLIDQYGVEQVEKIRGAKIPARLLPTEPKARTKSGAAA